MKYLRIFEKESDYTQYVGGSDDYVTPHVALIRNTNIIKCQIYVPDYTNDYLTIEALEDDLTVSFTRNTIQYSTDNCQTWIELPADTATPAINTGEKISFKATGLIPSERGGIGTFTVNKNFNLKGNVMSMLFGDEGKYSFDLTGYDGAFNRLFFNCSTLQSISKDFLPATTLTEGCYSQMFYNCASLVTAPDLPATTLTEGCYTQMFSNCASLVTAPDLPATTLTEGCYNSMFYSCTSLVTAPELPATELDANCYSNMFSNCASLVTAPDLPATTLAESCYRNMFSNCASLVTAPDLPATTLTEGCYNSMFYGCASLVTAPELPATTLTEGCYNYMFNDCTSLNYIKALFTTEPGSLYTANWVKGVSSTGTFVKNVAATWDVTGADGIPSGWIVETATV